jgi:uncharacterized protein
MNMSQQIAASAVALLIGGTFVAANGTRFSDYTPLTASAGPTADESTPITFGNPDFQQRSIADRATQLLANVPNTGGWDMNTTNETGPHKGRYVFTVFETGQSGVQRHDLLTGATDTIWHSLTPGTHVAFDPSFWTPWGTLIVGEESWCSGAAGCTTNPYGRLFEFTNPIDAPAIFNPLTAASNVYADFQHRNIVPRTSHEGMQFDRAGNFYFIDELDGGNLYMYKSAASWGEIKSRRAEYFEAGQTFVLRVGNGSVPNETGSFTWVPITDAKGAPLPGAISITDPNGVTSLDARNTTNLPQFKGTDYMRPEDMQIQSLSANDYLYVTTTSTHQVYRLDLSNRVISVFADRNTTDLATGAAVGSAFASPDNLAVDHDNNIYIVEDRGGAVDDDIWFANDLNKDGDLKDPGEGIGRWASNGTPGSEFTGLYFDPTNKRRAWVNIQHPSSGTDRTIEISIGDPAKGSR